jgi:hypothetical protein
MADAVGSVHWLQADNLFQIAQLAFGAPDLQSVAIAAHCNSG